MNNQRSYQYIRSIALIGLLFCAIQPAAYGQFREYVEISTCSQTVISGNPNTGENLCPDFSNVRVIRAPVGASAILSSRARVLVGESVIIQTNIWDDSQLRVNDKLSIEWKQDSTRKTVEDFLDATEIQGRPKKIGNLFFPFVHKATIEAGDLSGILGDVTYQIIGEFNVPNSGGLRRDSVSSPELTFTITTIQGFIPDQRVSVGDSISIDLNNIFSDRTYSSPLTYELTSADSSIVTPKLDKNLLTLEGNRNDITTIGLRVTRQNHSIIDSFKVQVTAIEGAIGDQRLKPRDTKQLEVKSFFTHPTDDLQFTDLEDTYNQNVVTADLSANELKLTGDSVGVTEITVSVRSNTENVTETFNVHVTDIEGALPDTVICIAGNNPIVNLDLQSIFSLNGTNLPTSSFELLNTYNTNIVTATLNQGFLELSGNEIGSTELSVLVTSGSDQYIDRFRVTTASCSAISGSISDLLLRKEGKPFIVQLDSIYTHTDSLSYSLTSPDHDTEIIDVDLDESNNLLTVTGKRLGITPLALEILAGQDTLINTLNVTVLEGDLTDQFLCIDDQFITHLDSIYTHPDTNVDLAYQVVDGSYNTDIVRIEQDQSLLRAIGEAPGNTPIRLQIIAGNSVVEDTLNIQVSRIEGAIADSFLRQDSMYVVDLNNTFSHPVIQDLDYTIIDSSFDGSIITPRLNASNVLSVEGIAFGKTSLSLRVTAGRETCIFTFDVRVTAIQGTIDDQVIFPNDSMTVNLNDFYSHSNMDPLDFSPGDPLDKSVADVQQVADTLLKITSTDVLDTTAVPITITADQDVFQDTLRVIVTNTPLVVAPIDSLVLPVGQLYTQSLVPVFKPRPISAYMVQSQDTSIAVASLTGSMLRIFPLKEGTVRITYSATNNASQTVDSSFVLAVIPPPFLRAFPDIETLTLNQDVRDTLNLSTYFGSRGNIPIDFEATSSDPAIADTKTSDEDRTLIVSLRDSADTGKSVDITVSADILGSKVTDTFKVIVNSPPTAKPIPDILWAVPNADSLEIMHVSLAEYFGDPDSTYGDRLSFSAISSDSTLVSTEISQGILTLEPLRLVDDVFIPIEITARDNRTGSISYMLSTRITTLAAPLGGIQVSKDAGVENRDLPVSIILDTPEINIDQANFSYRRGGDPGFTTLSKDSAMVRAVEGGKTELTFTIRASHLTNRGLEYKFDARSISGDAQPTESVSPEISLPGGLLASPISPGDHRLFSMPIKPQDAYRMLDRSLGPAGSNRWRLWEASQALDGELNLKEATSNSRMDLIPGKAYWLYVSDEAIDLVQSLPNALVNPVHEPFEVQLDAGWNLIGNPFTFTVPLSKVTLHNENEPCRPWFYAYTGKELTWKELTNELKLTDIEPFTGYAVYSDKVDTLRIDPDIHTADASDRSSCIDPLHEENTLMAISIAASSGFASNKRSIAAISSESSNDWDKSDQPSLPVIGEYVNVYFYHPEWEKPTSKFQVDARPEIQEGQVWNVRVESNTHDKVNLTFTGIEEVAAEYEVWLVDDVLNTSVNLRQTPAYTIGSSTSNAPRSLKLVVGTPSFQQEIHRGQQGLPVEYSLSQNFPNPFHQSTTISYSLPEDQSVTIEIFDVLGRRVTTLLREKDMQAGFHATIWDGRNTAGDIVASGLYIITWKAGDVLKTSKATLVR